VRARAGCEHGEASRWLGARWSWACTWEQLGGGVQEEEQGLQVGGGAWSSEARRSWAWRLGGVVRWALAQACGVGWPGGGWAVTLR
jgi:hypothetical protein